MKFVQFTLQYNPRTNSGKISYRNLPAIYKSTADSFNEEMMEALATGLVKQVDLVANTTGLVSDASSLKVEDQYLAEKLFQFLIKHGCVSLTINSEGLWLIRVENALLNLVALPVSSLKSLVLSGRFSPGFYERVLHTKNEALTRLQIKDFEATAPEVMHTETSDELETSSEAHRHSPQLILGTEEEERKESDPPGENKNKTKEQNEQALEEYEKISDEFCARIQLHIEAVDKALSDVWDVVDNIGAKADLEAAEKVGRTELSSANSAPIELSSGSAVSDPTSNPKLDEILKNLKELLNFNKQSEADVLNKKAVRYSNFGFGILANIVTVLGIWGIITSYKSSSSLSLTSNKRSVLTDSSQPESIDALTKIVQAWSAMDDATWWKYYSDYIKANNDLTINDQIVFLQMTMQVCPLQPVLWNNNQDRLDIADQLVSYYNTKKADGTDPYISDIYLQLPNLTNPADGTPLPRAAAAHEMILALGKILVDGLPVRRPSASNARVVISDLKIPAKSKAQSLTKLGPIVAKSVTGARQFSTHTVTVPSLYSSPCLSKMVDTVIPFAALEKPEPMIPVRGYVAFQPQFFPVPRVRLASKVATLALGVAVAGVGAISMLSSSKRIK